MLLLVLPVCRFEYVAHTHVCTYNYKPCTVGISTVSHSLSRSLAYASLLLSSHFNLYLCFTFTPIRKASRYWLCVIVCRGCRSTCVYGYCLYCCCFILFFIIINTARERKRARERTFLNATSGGLNAQPVWFTNPKWSFVDLLFAYNTHKVELYGNITIKRMHVCVCVCVCCMLVWFCVCDSDTHILYGALLFYFILFSISLLHI